MAERTQSINYELVAMDMDGTLLTSKKWIDPFTEFTIRQLVNTGVNFAIASGRFPASVWLHARYLNLSCPQVALNGSLIIDGVTGGILHETPFSESELMQMLAYVAASPARIQLYSFNALFVDDVTDQNQRWPLLNVVNNPDLPLTDVNYRLQQNYIRLYPVHGNWSCIGEQRNSIYKATIFAEHADLQTLLQVLEGIGLSVSFTGEERIDVNPPEVNKATGLAWICSAMKLLPEQVAAFGDGDNDVEMLRFAGLGVAMGNASGSALLAANDVANTNDQAGIAQYLNALMTNPEVD